VRQVQIQAARLSREEFPAFPAVKFDTSWKIKSGDLQKLIAHVGFRGEARRRAGHPDGVLWELRPDGCAWWRPMAIGWRAWTCH